MNPLLSICIPTYNRHESLKLLLELICEQIRFNSKVELVVSDNNSNDDTQKVLEKYSEIDNIRIYKNNSNIGAVGNILKLTQVLAKGEYIWVIGDDDLLMPGAIDKLVKLIEANRHIGYFFVNHIYECSKNRQSIYDEIKNSKPREFNTNNYLCFENDIKELSEFEEIILKSNTAGVMTSLVCHIMEARAWKKAKIDYRENNLYSTFEKTFPHLAIAYRNYSSKNVYYIGQPQIIFFIGDQEWFNEHWSRLMYTQLLDFGKTIKKNGQKEIGNYYQNLILNTGYDNFYCYLNSQKKSRKFLAYINLFKHYDNKNIVRMLFRILKHKAKQIVNNNLLKR